MFEIKRANIIIKIDKGTTQLVVIQNPDILL